MSLQRDFLTVVQVLVIALSGFISAYITIPLLAKWFGVTITITGASAPVGMYLFTLTAMIIGALAFFAFGMLYFLYLKIPSKD